MPRALNNKDDDDDDDIVVIAMESYNVNECCECPWHQVKSHGMQINVLFLLASCIIIRSELLTEMCSYVS